MMPIMSMFKEITTSDGQRGHFVVYNREITVRVENRYKTEQLREHPKVQARRLLNELLAEL